MKLKYFKPVSHDVVYGACVECGDRRSVWCLWQVSTLIFKFLLYTCGVGHTSNM